MKNTFLTFIITIFSLTCFAQDELLNEIKTGNLNNNAITADFTQTKILKAMNNKIVSNGKYYFLRDGKLSMQYTSPAGDIMVIDGEKMLMKTRGAIKKANTKSNKRMALLKDMLFTSMRADFDAINKYAKEVKCSQNSKFYTVVVTVDMVKTASSTSSIVITYNKTDKSIETLQLIEKNGDTTIYALTGKTLNKQIDGSLFSTDLQNEKGK